MCPSALWIGMSQMFAQAKLARRPARVKPERALAARNPSGRVENKQTQVVRRGNLKRSVLNDSNRPVRTRMPGGVGGVGQVTWPPLSRLTAPGLQGACVMRCRNVPASAGCSPPRCTRSRRGERRRDDGRQMAAHQTHVGLHLQAAPRTRERAEVKDQFQPRMETDKHGFRK